MTKWTDHQYLEVGDGDQLPVCATQRRDGKQDIVFHRLCSWINTAIATSKFFQFRESHQ